MSHSCVSSIARLLDETLLIYSVRNLRTSVSLNRCSSCTIESQYIRVRMIRKICATSRVGGQIKLIWIINTTQTDQAHASDKLCNEAKGKDRQWKPLHTL